MESPENNARERHTRVNETRCWPGGVEVAAGLIVAAAVRGWTGGILNLTVARLRHLRLRRGTLLLTVPVIRPTTWRCAIVGGHQCFSFPWQSPFSLLLIQGKLAYDLMTGLVSTKSRSCTSRSLGRRDSLRQIRLQRDRLIAGRPDPSREGQVPSRLKQPRQDRLSSDRREPRIVSVSRLAEVSAGLQPLAIPAPLPRRSTRARSQGSLLQRDPGMFLNCHSR